MIENCETRETLGRGSLSATQAEELARACDRFEAEWRKGGRPRIEDHLAEVPEPLRAALLGELISVELDWRRRNDERPVRDEYEARFPGQAGAVAAAFGPAADQTASTADTARSVDPANGLLLGLLAFQNNLIDRDALLTALDVWAAEKNNSLGRILVAQGSLDASTLALVEALASRHIEIHGGDTEKSLAALRSIASIADDLKRITDPDLQASLMHLTATTDHGDPTAPSGAVGESTSSGGRFVVLRPHARGGLPITIGPTTV